MSFYIRKSLRFGPVRFNLSKSGVGVSAGIKGFRIGSSPRGNYIHMGRHGLYYRTTLPSGKKSSSKTSNYLTSTDSPTGPMYDKSSDIVMEEIDSGDIGHIVDSSSSNLVSELNSKQSKISFAPIVLMTGLALSAILSIYKQYLILTLPMLIISIMAFVLVMVWDRNKKTTIIFYDMIEDASKHYKSIYEAFSELSKTNKVWHISAKGDINDSKYHAGADQAVKRTTTHIKFNNPKNVKTNIPTPNINVGTQSLYFFPDKILIFEKNRVGGLGYENVNFEIQTTHFVEEQGVPHDSRVVGKTWRYVNKRGGPDKRFKDNHEIPIAEYETVHFKSKSGLNELIHISKVGTFSKVSNSIEGIIKYAKKLDKPITPMDRRENSSSV
jgi:hypothetical protein